MSQFPPPPPGPAYGAPAVDRPWSRLAIWALVLAVIPCSSPLGLVLGIFALFVTLGGARRGLVLAILSLPVAVVTGGCLTGAVYVVHEFSLNLLNAKQAVKPALAGGSFDGAEVLAELTEFMTHDLAAAIDTTELVTWADLVTEEHGAFREEILGRMPLQQPTEDGQGLIWSYPCKFINGEANLTLTFARNPGDVLWLKLDDIDVEGISLREVAAQAKPAVEPDATGTPQEATEKEPTEDAPEPEGG